MCSLTQTPPPLSTLWGKILSEEVCMYSSYFHAPELVEAHSSGMALGLKILVGGQVVMRRAAIATQRCLLFCPTRHLLQK